LRPVGDDGMQLTARIDAAGQDDVFDRAIGGARYGARTLVDARLGLARGRWSIEMWGLNLSDERYISAAASRGAVFFPTTPRPLDLLVGPGRRFGVTFMLQD
jgi:outer membrane receptor protein involved in Fe transport